MQSLFKIISNSVFFWVGPNPQVFSQDLTWLFELSGAILKFISKCDVRIDSISHMPFQDRFQIISFLAQPLCFSFSRSISVILVVFLVIIWRSKKIYHKSCPFPRRFPVLARCYAIKLFLVMQILFIHPKYVRSCLPISFNRRPSFQLSFSIYPDASFKRVLHVPLYLNHLAHVSQSIHTLPLSIFSCIPSSL